MGGDDSVVKFVIDLPDRHHLGPQSPFLPVLSQGLHRIKEILMDNGNPIGPVCGRP